MHCGLFRALGLRSSPGMTVAEKLHASGIPPTIIDRWTVAVANCALSELWLGSMYSGGVDCHGIRGGHFDRRFYWFSLWLRCSRADLDSASRRSGKAAPGTPRSVHDPRNTARGRAAARGMILNEGAGPKCAAPRSNARTGSSFIPSTSARSPSAGTREVALRRSASGGWQRLYRERARRSR
jgi:hypothetical protein